MDYRIANVIRSLGLKIEDCKEEGTAIRCGSVYIGGDFKLVKEGVLRSTCYFNRYEEKILVDRIYDANTFLLLSTNEI